MTDDENRRRFELLAMPHLDAAYNQAMWLTRNEHDAQDVVQEALVRAMRYIGGLRSEGARAWLLQINAAIDALPVSYREALVLRELHRSGPLQRVKASPRSKGQPSATLRLWLRPLRP